MRHISRDTPPTPMAMTLKTRMFGIAPIREELLYAYYESEEENDVEEEVREWIDGDFILGDRFFTRSAYEEMDPTRAPAPGLRCVHSNRYGS